MKFLSSARGRWFALAALWVLLLVLGIGGFLQQASDGGFHRPFLDTLYLTLQLATLDYGGGDEMLNWRLQITRFAAPIISAGTVLQGASVVCGEQFRRFRLRFARNHTVVCGLGDVGTRIAVAFAAAGETVVAIETDANSTGAATARENGITVLIGRGSDPSLLRTARVDRAARVVAVCGDDATNVQIALTTADVVKTRNGKALRCSVHLTDAELAHLLRIADLDANGAVRLSFFNVHERAARSLLVEHPPFTGDHVHVMVFGLGQLGRSTVVAQQWVEQHPDQRLPITLVDRAATGRWEALRLQHPALGEVCAPRLLDLDLDAPAAGKVDELRAIFSDDRPSWAVVAFDDESLALSSALFVHQSLADASVQVVVRTRSDAGLAALLAQRVDGADSFPGLRAFPFLDRTCTRETVDGGLREELAQSVHADYLNHTRADLDAGSGLKRQWSELDDDQRDLSRRRVDGIVADLAVIGLTLSPLRRWGSPAVTLDDAQVEQLAAREHQRWRDDREKTGWTYGAIRDDQLKRNPLLVPWAELPPAARTMNLDSARMLPELLARAGFEPVPA
jgi:hypothetical protein